ncbi:MAG TPA: ABC transporter permease, partial [Solirubrobacteraceae bacterium]|nr:ABC transporter permease [Solirubrobacteraceae bacterium]
VVAVLAAGLRDTTEGAAERRVQATHVVSSQDGWTPTDPAIAGALAKADGVNRVTTIKQDGARAFGDTERVNGLDAATADELFAFDYADGAATTVSALGRDGAIVDEGLAKEHGLALGDRFEITSASGTKLDLVVRGIETSPVLDAFDLGPISVSSEAYASAFRNERNVYTFVDADSAAAIERALTAYPDTKVLDKAQFVQDRMEAIDMLMAIFAVLLALAVIVSLFGIVNALVLATFERRRELGMLAAVGMTRRQIRRMVRHESIVTALMGVSSGIVVGLAGGYAVTSALSDEGLTFAVPGGTLVTLAIVGVIAGVLAAVLPARRAARMSPLSALAYE